VLAHVVLGAEAEAHVPPHGLGHGLEGLEVLRVCVLVEQPDDRRLKLLIRDELGHLGRVVELRERRPGARGG